MLVEDAAGAGAGAVAGVLLLLLSDFAAGAESVVAAAGLSVVLEGARLSVL